MYLESQNICKNCRELFVILLRIGKLPHHHLQNLKMFSLICKSHKSVSTGETVFHIPQSACYILGDIPKTIQTSLYILRNNGKSAQSLKMIG